MRNKDEKNVSKGLTQEVASVLRDAHWASWASNDFLIHSEGIVSSSRCRKERSGAGKTSMDNSYTLFKVGCKKMVPLGEKIYT